MTSTESYKKNKVVVATMKDQGLVYSKYFIKGDLIIMVLIINTWLRLGNVHGHIDCWLETGNKQQSLSKSDVNMNLYAAL